MSKAFRRGMVVGTAALFWTGVALSASTHAGTAAQAQMGQGTQMDQGTMTSPQPSSATSPAQGQQAGAMTASSFATEATNVNQFEIEAGKLAEKKASNKSVKQFGQMMQTDHSKLQKELTSTAQREKIPIPSQMSSEQKQKIDRLTSLQGDAFDREYMQLMVDDHRHDVAYFQQAASQLDNQPLRDWASQSVSILQQHLDEAQKINDQLRSGAGQAS